ncbi:quinone oxidoreductase family protein [Microbacterium sp.]|uniref:quinone oxidoreductase family protein n=1 Tax=Microbacterium sp. TaxID=51671 RepID=UPI003BAEE084
MTDELVSGHSLMRAVVLDRFGGVEELKTRLLPVPEVGDDDVLIRVHVAGVGSWDAAERRGDFDGAFGTPSVFPYVLGWDAAGTIASVGRDVSRFRIGDRVYAATTPLPRGGFYAEYGVVPAEHVTPLPDRLPFEQAGAMAWDALTALSGLDLLDLEPGDAVMVFGASGGIGHLALQLARHRGLRVLAVASGDDGVALARRLGADAVVDGRRADVLAAAAEFAPDGLDGALVTVGGETTERALRALTDSGRIAWPHGVHPLPSDALGSRVSFYDGDRSRAAAEGLNAIIDSSDLEVHIARTFALDDAPSAHRALGDHYIGKLALRVAPDDRRE